MRTSRRLYGIHLWEICTGIRSNQVWSNISIIKYSNIKELNKAFISELLPMRCHHDKLSMEKYNCDILMTSSNGMVSALTALCEGIPPVTGGFPLQRASKAVFGVFYHGSLKNRLKSKTRPIYSHLGTCMSGISINMYWCMIGGLAIFVSLYPNETCRSVAIVGATIVVPLV